MNAHFLFTLSYLRALLAVMACGESTQDATRAPAPRRLRPRPSRRQLKRRAAGAGARPIDPGAGIIAQTRGA